MIELPTKYGFVDITGTVYSRLTVISFAGSTKRGAAWLCRCRCGTEKVLIGGDIRSGRVQSCGCWKSEVTSQRSRTHRESATPLYVVWSSMKKRCNNPRNKGYKNYGERGIRVCKEWSESYEAFRDWSLANGYAAGLEIDRRNNDGNYEPDNCRWVAQKINARNTRRNRSLSAFGETKTLIEWCEDGRCAVNYNTLRRRLGRGWAGEEALTKRSGAA